MSYGLIYTIPFATLDNIPCTVEIEKEDYSGKVTELTAGSSPFKVDIEDEEFLYTPTRFSTATIRVVGSDYLQDLFSIGYQQFRVIFKKHGIITWCGFIKPELYTQDYSSETFELELECMSAMSTLEFIDYKQNAESKVFISLWDILKKCVISSNSQYTGIYIPHVYAKNIADYSGGINVLEDMSISEQNFFDEDDKPMKLKEVLEEVCKLLSLTCVDWRGELFFVDVDHIGEFYKYNSVSFEKIGVRIPELNNIQDIGFSGSEHYLDILPGYNKVTVKCSNYSIASLFSQDEGYDGLDILQTPSDIVDENRACHRQFLDPRDTQMLQYTLNSNGEFVKLDSLSSYKGDVNSLFGAVPMKYCNYELENGKPKITEYSYTDVIRVRYKSAPGEEIPQLDNYVSLLRIKGPCAVYSDGAFTLNGALKSLFEPELSPLKAEDFFLSRKISFFLRIGKNYYTDSGWSTTALARDLTLRRESGEEFQTISNGKTLDMPYDGATGFIMPIDRMLTGDFEFILLSSRTGRDYSEVGRILKDFKIDYVKENAIGIKSSSNSDRIYENVINEKYINELDEIELKISSYNNDGACYSKVILGDEYLTDNLYSAIEETTARPEEQLIRRIIKRYSAPRIKLTQVIKETSDLTPISRLYDNYMVNKRFINAGGTIDYQMNQFQCIMIEV